MPLGGGGGGTSLGATFTGGEQNNNRSNSNSPSESPYSNTSLSPGMPHSATTGLGGATSFASFRLERTGSLAMGPSNFNLTRKKSYVVTLTDNVRQQLQQAMLERKKSMALAAGTYLTNTTTTTTSQPNQLDSNNSNSTGSGNLKNAPTKDPDGAASSS